MLKSVLSSVFFSVCMRCVCAKREKFVCALWRVNLAFFRRRIVKGKMCTLCILCVYFFHSIREGWAEKIIKKKTQQAHSIRYFSAFSSYSVLACWQMVCVSKFGFDHDHGLALCVESCLICRLLCRLTYTSFILGIVALVWSCGVFFWKLMDAVCVLYVFPLWKERYMIFCTYCKIIAIK